MSYKQEGPITRESESPKRKVCNQCKWCREARLFTMRNSEIWDASCEHPHAKYKPYFDNNLDFRGQNVFTPDWCPVEKINNKRSHEQE